MPLLTAGGEAPDREALDVAARALRAGEVVVLPTDTVYGLAIDPTKPGAADRLFALKRRSRDVPLALLVDHADQVERVVDLATAHPAASTLMARFWPGPLTIVLPRRPGVTADLGSAVATVGVRCPDHPVPRALAARVGPIAATSANLHGHDTPATAREVAEHLELDAGAVVLDAGTSGGAPSTVVDATGPELRCLREGALAFAAILGAAEGTGS